MKISSTSDKDDDDDSHNFEKEQEEQHSGATPENQYEESIVGEFAEILGKGTLSELLERGSPYFHFHQIISFSEELDVIPLETKQKTARLCTYY